MAAKRVGVRGLATTGMATWVLLGGVAALTGCAGMADRSASLGAEDQRAAAAACPSEMIHIPAGTFWMGSEEGKADQRPAHDVTVDGFCIDRTEVTVAAYAECVSRGDCETAATTVFWPGINEEDRALDSQFCNRGRTDRQQHPINCVTWTQADTFCRAAGKRLPTEEEWEYAARGDDGRTYPWGDAAPSSSLLNSLGAETVAMGERLGHPGWVPMYTGNDGWETTSPVGSYPEGASPFGVLDMAGNVWEWTSSGYSQDYWAESDSDRHVSRGGAWGYGDEALVRTSYRGKGVLEYRGADVGFRCAASLP